MISPEEVRSAILGVVETLSPLDVYFADAVGLVVADDVVSRCNVPPFANTAMDGYAVRAADTEGATDDAPVRLRVVDALAAGTAPTTSVDEGTAIRIMTGAPMPDGADAIVMIEVTERDGADRVLVRHQAEPGDHVRAAGGDVQAGEVVLAAGTVVRPAHLGVLVSIDARHVRVHPRPRVGVLSTGDELVESGPIGPGQIRDANRPMLVALLADAGFEYVDLGIARDDEEQTTALILDALDQCDALVTSGGVSVGDFDHVSSALARITADDPDPRARVDWYQIAIRPAKPLCFSFAHGTPVFGLPGNPVSSLVSFEMFARPALKAMAGYVDVDGPVVLARAAQAMPREPDGKLHLDRVTLELADGRYVASSVRAQASNQLLATAGADGLAFVPDGDGIAAGDDVLVQLL